MAADVGIKLGLDLGDFTPNANKAERSLAAIGTTGQTSARQISAATRQLPAQFTDIATSLAGGQNPFTVLLQQGGQIKDSFGGVGNAIRGVASAINPATIAIGGVAAVLGGLAAAFKAGDQDAARLRSTLALTGNAAGLTADSFDQLAGRIVNSTRQTVGESKSIIEALAATGQTSAKVLESQATAIGRIADLSGKSGSDIAAGFAGQLEAPAKFAAKLNETYNFLSVAEFKRIQTLEAQRKNAEAATLTNELLTKGLEAEREQLGYVEQLWRGIGIAMSFVVDKAKSIGRPDTLASSISDQLAALERLRGELANIELGAGGTIKQAGTDYRRRLLQGDIEAAQDRLRDLTRRQDIEQTNAIARSEKAAAARTKIADILATPQKKSDMFVGPLSFDEQFPAAKVAEILGGRTANRQARVDELMGGDAIIRALADVDAQRAAAQRDFLQGTVDANARTSARLIDDERERGLALIDLDRQTAERRIAAAGFTGARLAEALSAVSESTALAQVELDRQITDRLQKSTDATSDRLTQSISEGCLEGFRKGSNFADIFVSELKAQFARTILQPLIRPQVEAGNNILQSLLGGLGGLFSGGSSGLSVPAADFATGDIIRGRRAAGGPVAAGGTYLVGEQGPELLRMGGQSGTIVPNSAMGGVSVTLAPIINIEARSDQAQIAQLVSGAMVETKRSMFEELRARRVLG